MVCPTRHWKLHDRMFVRLDKTPECDGRAERQKDRWNPKLVQRSALQAMRTHCKNSTEWHKVMRAATNYWPWPQLLTGEKSNACCSHIQSDPCRAVRVCAESRESRTTYTITLSLPSPGHSLRRIWRWTCRTQNSRTCLSHAAKE